MRKRNYRRWILGGSLTLVLILGFAALLGEFYVAPALRNRLETLIVKGSDSLYRYELGDLKASFFGGNIEVDELHISVDSNRYGQLKAVNALPPVTMELEVHHAHIRGLGVFALLFAKRISIHELFSSDARVVLVRHNFEDTVSRIDQPLWKSIRPAIKSVVIDEIRLEGTHLLYRTEDTTQSFKLQFDTCNAVFRDVRIDSLAATNKERIGFAKQVAFQFNDLKYRSPDSTIKLKAKLIGYDSRHKTLSIAGFKLQPTLKEKEAFYAAVRAQKSMSVIEFDKMEFTNFRLQDFLHGNAFIADSLLVDKPVVSIYLDKTQPPLMASRIGRYPHQLLLASKTRIYLEGMALRHLDLSYSEKGEKSGQEGVLRLDDVHLVASHVTNIPQLLKKQNTCKASLWGKMLGSSPVEMNLTFYLDAADGRFDAAGSIRNVQAAQLNRLAEPLANMKLQSLNLEELRFQLTGDDFSAQGEVGMRYTNLFVILQKRDDSGVVSTKKLMTKLVNKYTLESSNPGPDGTERIAKNVVRSRLTTQGFFGLIWKTIFTGMQGIMTNTQ